ncbi:hypothetical protein KP79_PYT01381 [Mizuhopecten yessoensis]|uniref:Uncharacterized protein n=1 Tax=Mizuhopecten yessoensis TaxID=6573 RepID=A0A210QDP1_MIZYE|nr:hypothetical protein KP79_PYT01381 [Mizuhopecten yessoensis]
MIRDGLRLPNINILQAEGKQKHRRGDKPGVVIAIIETLDQKHSVMKKKNTLKQCRDYSNVYIDNDISQSELDTQCPLQTVLREIGKQHDYKVYGNRIVKVKEPERNDTGNVHSDSDGWRIVQRRHTPNRDERRVNRDHGFATDRRHDQRQGRRHPQRDNHSTQNYSRN